MREKRERRSHGGFFRIHGRVHKAAREFRLYHAEKEKAHIEFHRKVNDLYKTDRDLYRYHRRVKYIRPVILIVNLAIWFFLFYHFGVKVLSVVFAVLISMGGIFEFIFLLNLEKRIFKPLNQLREGVEEIAKGNYGVNVTCDVRNEISVLVNSFNEMAKKLQESERLKHEYEENRKTLVANISHDLKTPVTSIQGYIETMLDRTDISQENINKYHKVIYNNAAYINKLIDDLFLFSKLDMQKLELQFEYINLRAFMEDIMQEFMFELEDRGIEFRYEDNMSEVTYVNIDRKRVNQIFKNIIGNAVKYGMESNTVIKVRLYEKESLACIDIEDNGPGIPKDKLPYIFDRFYRIDYARTKDLMSTGLGLAISKELVEAHKGKISVASEEGKGTCFNIMLPMEKSVEGE